MILSGLTRRKSFGFWTACFSVSDSLAHVFIARSLFYASFTVRKVYMQVKIHWGFIASLLLKRLNVHSSSGCLPVSDIPEKNATLGLTLASPLPPFLPFLRGFWLRFSYVWCPRRISIQDSRKARCADIIIVTSIRIPSPWNLFVSRRNNNINRTFLQVL